VNPQHRIRSGTDEPQELVGPLLLLASDAGSYMTGEIVKVDGGTSSVVGMSPYDESFWALHAAAMPDGLGEPIRPIRAAA
jgi:hypothetical protein